MATLEDIGRVLGVSKSTVSKALSGADDVSEAMRRSVLETAVELGYSRPHRDNEAPRIALFITNMGYQKPEDFGHDIVMGFRKLAEPAGYSVSILPLDYALENSISYDEYMMRGKYVGGCFLGLSLDHPWLKDFETCRIPTILYDNQITGNPMLTYVGANNVEGMYLAVEYLKKLNHRKIGYLSSALGAFVYQQRHRAFFQALRENALPCEDSLAKTSLLPSVCVKEHLPALLEQGCTAIMCSHDSLAAAALVRCRELGIRVPEEVSIIGFDDMPFSQFTQPPLTTIRQNRTEIGKSAFCALASQMHNVPLSVFLLHTELVERGSCCNNSEQNKAL